MVEEVSKMKVGDLVALKKWCRDSPRPAMIVGVGPHHSAVKIMFLDSGLRIPSLKLNLKVISESR